MKKYLKNAEKSVLLFRFREFAKNYPAGGFYTGKAIACMPDYYPDFSCKCGECRRVCCDGWGISVTEEEYFRLIGLQCGKGLRHKLDTAFVPADSPEPGRFALIAPDFHGNCPMLAEDGYCSLQREKGEKTLPLICRVYPRSVKRCGGRYEICVSNSCEKTIELLLESTKPVSFIEAETELPFEGIFVYGEDSARDNIRKEAVNAMQNREKAVGERIFDIGTLLCGDMKCPIVSGEASMHELRRFITAIEKHSLSILDCGGKALLHIEGLDDAAAYAVYLESAKHLYDAVPDIEAYIEKIIVNHMLYECFPYVSGCDSTEKAYSSFCYAAALLRFICVLATDNGGKQALADLLSESYRFIEHTDFYSFCPRVTRLDGAGAYALLKPLF